MTIPLQQHGMGMNPQGMGMNPHCMVMNPQGRGMNPHGMGMNPQGMGMNPHGMGMNPLPADNDEPQSLQRFHCPTCTAEFPDIDSLELHVNECVEKQN